MCDVFVRVLSNLTTKPATANGTSGTTSNKLTSTAGDEGESVHIGSSAKPVTANSTGGTNNEYPLLGCGLSYLVTLIKENYADKKNRHNKIPTRLIGAQAIALARYAYRLTDSLHSSDESPVQRVTRLAPGRVVLHLREAFSIFNKVSTTQADLQDLDENCKLYFILMCLFFSTHVNITSWTVAFAIP